jgi:hypothetical protein
MTFASHLRNLRKSRRGKRRDSLVIFKENKMGDEMERFCLFSVVLYKC